VVVAVLPATADRAPVTVGPEQLVTAQVQRVELTIHRLRQ